MPQGELEDDIYNQVELNKKNSMKGILERLNRSLSDIQPLWPEATKLELYIAFNKSLNDPNQLATDLEDKNFKEFIKDLSKDVIDQSNAQPQKKMTNSTIHSSMQNRDSDDDYIDLEHEEEEKEEELSSKDDDDSDSDFQNESLEPRRWNLRRSTRNSQPAPPQQESDQGEALDEEREDKNDEGFENASDESDDDFCYSKSSSSTKKSKKKETKKAQTKSTKKKPHKEQDNIDLPRPKEIKLSDWETWSFAHKQSYLKGSKNANAYYYRNLKQGEKARNGKWTPEETKLFLNRIKVMAAKKNFYDSTPQWGIFSMTIPGRVGYQCANYYRNLVLEGKIYDPRYKVIDGKLKYIAFHQKENKRSKSKSKSKYDKDSDNGDFDDNNTDSSKNLSIYERYARENPLIGAVDGITGETIRVPAISPDGYLLEYNTWLKIITQTGQDPYTTNHLTKRSLVILNYDNIEEYRDKIKNLVMES